MSSDKAPTHAIVVQTATHELHPAKVLSLLMNSVGSKHKTADDVAQM